MIIELGSDATATKSAGVRVIPMESMRAARAAVKYSVVNHSKVDGRLSAMAVKRTVHRGKRVVARFAVLVYASNILADVDFSSEGGEEDAAASVLWMDDDARVRHGGTERRLFRGSESGAGGGGQDPNRYGENERNGMFIHSMLCQRENDASHIHDVSSAGGEQHGGRDGTGRDLPFAWRTTTTMIRPICNRRRTCRTDTTDGRRHS